MALRTQTNHRRRGANRRHDIRFTGRTTGFTRPEAEARVARLGGRAAPDVSRKVSYVVAGDEPGSKASRARELGVPSSTNGSLVRLLGEARTPLATSGITSQGWQTDNPEAHQASSIALHQPRRLPPPCHPRLGRDSSP